MRLPRRVPWQDLSELEQLCGWIYADENDLDATRRAVHRLAAWKASVPLPHALESAHAILSVILQDGNSATSSSYLSLRMSYASALIRLVNGLVDPLQLGAYARSINSIAQQLGLPAWYYATQRERYMRNVCLPRFSTDARCLIGNGLATPQVLHADAESIDTLRSAGEDGGRFMLSQQDAQLLAIHVQRFYLWNEGSEERAALMKAFHETPADFKWEELLKHTNFSA
ncbi:hypothetical protein NUW54_g3114 [Trametes sanguinea]|uniref:Uncharacterized protein n=1 Tax=Trametes sanguinea TaxID=158606 RepID=A0ACC1Q4U6_9APHY|nr:hypothetical protein NUW54_g3114 [Trametes sanguinea]